MKQEIYSILCHLPVIGRYRVNFYNCSSSSYELYLEVDEFQRQRGIKHLGLISKVFDCSNHSRYEYVMLQCALVDIVDKFNKGQSQVVLGEINIEGQTFSGNALIKSWFLLSNLGQCKNTYGDNKSLLLYLLQNKQAKKEFLSVILDSQLKSACRKIIDNYEYTKFNLVIAAYRIHKIYYNKPKKKLQVLILKLLLLDERKYPNLAKNWPKLNQLRHVAKTIRNIAIISIDGHYSHTPISMDIMSAVSSMADQESAYNDLYLSKSLTPILGMLSEEIYLDRDIIALQRTYEVAAINRIRQNNDIHESLQIGLSSGLVEHIEPMVPFLRIKLPKETQPNSSLYTEFRNVQQAKRGISCVELMLDENYFLGHRYLDVLVNDSIERDEIGTIYYKISELVKKQVAYLVSNRNPGLTSLKTKVQNLAEDSVISNSAAMQLQDLITSEIVPTIWDGLQHSVSPAYRAILYSALNYVFDSKFKIDLQHVQNGYKTFDFSFPEFDKRFLSENFDNARQLNSADEDRVHEINLLEKQLRGTNNKYVYLCVDRLLVLDMEVSPDKRKWTDLDGVLLVVGDKGARLEIIEAKNTAKPVKDAIKDIRKKVIPALDKKHVKGYTINKLKGKGAKLVVKF